MANISAQSLENQIILQEWPKELRSLAQQFNAMLARIQTAFTQLSQFSSDIAHELRTPIHNLKNITEAALLKESSPKEYQQVLENSMEEYGYLSKLVENLLFIARSDHGQISLQKTLIDAHSEIQHICEYYT